MGLIEFLQGNWEVVTAAPWAFATMAVLFLSIGFAVGRFVLSEQIANLRSRIEARDEQILALRAELKDDEVDNHGSASDRRYFLIGRLTARYLHAHPDAPQRMKVGLDEPPAEWINSELAKLGEEWRVRLGPDGRFEILEPGGKG